MKISKSVKTPKQPKKETPTEQRDESNKYRGVDTTQWYVNLSDEIYNLR